MKIYLAGGFASDWRRDVKALTKHAFIDPKEKEAVGKWSMDAIGAWDLSAVRQSDCVFAYMERMNPSGFGLACEIGYAYGIGKLVVLVLEPGHTVHKDRYLDFMRKVSSVTFPTFDGGLNFLASLP